MSDQRPGADDGRWESHEDEGFYHEPSAYRGSVARTLFDRPDAEDGTVAILLPQPHIAALSLGALVRIDSVVPDTHEVEAVYIGAVVSGPFVEPDALGADSPALKIPAAHGAIMTPRFHGFARVQVFAVESGGILAPPTRRPMPNSPVFVLGAERVAEVLGLREEPEKPHVRVGLLEGAHRIPVRVPTLKKSVLGRHLGILGTTGGGKSTTVAGMVAGLAAAGNAVVVFDTEGEYTTANEPTEDAVMRTALTQRGMAPRGVAESTVFVLHGRKPANPKHPRTRRFKLAFHDLSVHTLLDLLDLSEPQQRRLLEAHEVCKSAMERLKLFPVTPDDQRRALEHDEYDAGWPKMSLSMLLDVVSAGVVYARLPSERKSTRKAKPEEAEVEEESSPARFEARSRAFRGQESVVWQVLTSRQLDKNEPSWRGIASKLWRLLRADVFSEREDDWIHGDDLLRAGGVSIVDLSDMDAPYLRNLVIAHLLRAVQAEQEERYTAHEAGQCAVPAPVNLVLEEAHEFLSEQRIRQMPNLFEQVARVARRGRKRHLGLVFVTQLPSHLPDEVLGLLNNWVLHKLSDANVLQRLKRVVPGVDAATWAAMPNLAPGQAVCSFTHLARPVRVSIDPAPFKLRLVE